VNIEPREFERRMSRFREALKRAGVKLTHQRLEIFREAAGSGDHPDAEAIYRSVRRRIPPIALDTVYRTLWMLFDLELIDTLGPRDRIRFDANTNSHHHFVCKRCGMIRDFTSVVLDGLKIPEAIKDIGAGETTRTEVRGICHRCLKADGPSHPSIKKRSAHKRRKA
jgi:Fur family transcriptional regulator, peroxide stress response regulator